MSFCTKCGKELAPDAAFCQHCGAKVQTANKVYSVYMRGTDATSASTQLAQAEQSAPQQADVQPEVKEVEQPVLQTEVAPVAQQIAQPAPQQVTTPAMQAGRAKYCTHCGSLIDENAVVCVRCGCNTDANKTPAKKKFNGLAIAGFVLSFFDYFCILGLIFSIIAIVVINKKDQRGKGLAIAGMVISIVITVLLAMTIIENGFGNGVEFTSTYFNLW